MALFVTRAAKGAWKVPTSAPVYLRHVHLPGAPLTTHAREQQEAHLRAPASLRLDPPCPRRARFDQNNRAWRTWSLLWGKEAVQSCDLPKIKIIGATMSCHKARFSEGNTHFSDSRRRVGPRDNRKEGR